MKEILKLEQKTKKIVLETVGNDQPLGTFQKTVTRLTEYKSLARDYEMFCNRFHFIFDVLLFFKSDLQAASGSEHTC